MDFDFENIIVQATLLAEDIRVDGLGDHSAKNIAEEIDWLVTVISAVKKNNNELTAKIAELEASKGA